MLLATLCLTACGSDSSSSPHARAISACNDFLAVGVGDRYVSRADRRAALESAITVLSAPGNDALSAELLGDLTELRRDEAAGSYAASVRSAIAPVDRERLCGRGAAALSLRRPREPGRPPDGVIAAQRSS
jgi:hypothetical protein